MGLNPDKTGLAWLRDLTGGLNDSDAPHEIGDTQCQIAQNVEWTSTRVAQRRQGGTNGIHATEPWTSQKALVALMRHTPTADEAAAELWGVDGGVPAVMGRMAAGNQFAAVTVGDAWSTGDANWLFINGVSLNGKFFIAGNTAVDRLHVWDGTSLRRVGLATPAAPTVANTGAGTYAATLRYYKVQYVNLTGFPTTRSPKSELSPAIAFTPSGTGTHARITKPAAINEGETDWVILGSPDGVNYYTIGSAVVGTTTFDDNVNPADYAANVAASLVGFPTDADYFTVPISPKYVLADDDRLILLGSWETASMASAVMWSPVIGTTPFGMNVADEERVPSGNRLDVDRQHGGGITGGALWNGSLWVFKLSQIHELIRTGDDDQPYRPGWSHTSIGAISHKSIVVAEDESGASALYFWSKRGPYRLSQAGLEYLGRDIEATWRSFNKSATVPTGSSQTPDKKCVFHVRYGRRDERGHVRGGWAIHTEGAADAISAVMFANTLGATMSLDLKPYIGQRWVTSLPDGPCIKYDADGTYTDRGGNATTYIARLKTKAFTPAGDGQKGGVTQIYILGTPANRTLVVDVVRDFGVETRSGTATLPAAVASETRVEVKVEDDAAAADAKYIEIVIDDDTSPASGAAWTVDGIGIRIRQEAQI
jgi:hypothetical protein